MRLLTKAGLGLAVLLVSIAIAPAAKADPITIQSSGFALQGLANNGSVANGVDSLIGAAASSVHTVNGAGSFIATLNPLTFITGFTGIGSGGNHPFNFSQLVTINGQTQTLNIFGSIDITPHRGYCPHSFFGAVDVQLQYLLSRRQRHSDGHRRPGRRRRNFLRRAEGTIHRDTELSYDGTGTGDAQFAGAWYCRSGGEASPATKASQIVSSVNRSKNLLNRNADYLLAGDDKLGRRQLALVDERERHGRVSA